MANFDSLSPDFAKQIESRLNQADLRRSRLYTLRRFLKVAELLLPAVLAVTVALLPWTFGEGMRALVGAAAYTTLVVSVADRASSGFLTYVGLGPLPVIVDILLLVGVVSWLSWAARPQQRGNVGDSRTG